MAGPKYATPVVPCAQLAARAGCPMPSCCGPRAVRNRPTRGPRRTHAASRPAAHRREARTHACRWPVLAGAPSSPAPTPLPPRTPSTPTTHNRRRAFPPESIEESVWISNIDLRPAGAVVWWCVRVAAHVSAAATISVLSSGGRPLLGVGGQAGILRCVAEGVCRHSPQATPSEPSCMWEQIRRYADTQIPPEILPSGARYAANRRNGWLFGRQCAVRSGRVLRCDWQRSGGADHPRTEGRGLTARGSNPLCAAEAQSPSASAHMHREPRCHAASYSNVAAPSSWTLLGTAEQVK